MIMMKSIDWCGLNITTISGNSNSDTKNVEANNNIYTPTIKPKQNSRHFANATFKCIFLDGNVLISVKISLTFVSIGRIDNIPFV